MLVGLGNGTITSIKEYMDADDMDARTEIMHSHSIGEVWGLANVNGECIITSGDDNCVHVWDFAQRKKIKSYKVSDRKKTRAGKS